ncbi:MAG: response regulator [Ardenticatenaceae bacterium]
MSLRELFCADHHPIARQGLRTWMDSEPELKLIGEAANEIETVQKAQTLKPDLILLDVMMGNQTCLEVIQEIKSHQPDMRILVFTSFAQDSDVFQVMKQGVLGYQLKNSELRELRQAIYDVSNGKPSLHPTVALKLMNGEQPPYHEALTEREVQVLKFVAQGLTNKDIAATLIINERTAGNYVCNVLKKLELTNRTQAALYALKVGLVSL